MAWGGTSDPLQFTRAMDWFENKVPVRRNAFDWLSGKWQRHAFTAANVTQTQMVARIWTDAQTALAEGTGFKAFKASALEYLAKEWAGEVKRPAHRLETIYRNALQSSYNAGRFDALTDDAVLQARPIWVYDAILDGNTTDICIARNGVRRHHTDPWWKTNYPPLHHRCRSLVRSDRATAGETPKPGQQGGPDDIPVQDGWGLAPNIAEWNPDPTEWPVNFQKAYAQKQKYLAKMGKKAATGGKPAPAPYKPKPAPPKGAKKPKPAKSSKPEPKPTVHAEPPPQATKPPVQANTPEKVYMHAKLEGAKGSNTGGVYQGSDGVKRYVKIYDDPQQAYSEHLVNSIYRDLGLDAPESMVFHLDDGRVAYASRWMDGVQQVGSRLDDKIADQILDGYMADVFTANWDAVGLNLDNVVTLPGGRVVRVDNGGSLMFRAQAGKKSQAAFNAMSEYRNFADASINPAYARVFAQAGIVDPDQLAARFISQSNRIIAMGKNDGWLTYVDSLFPTLPQAERRALVRQLNTRTALLRAQHKQLQAAKKAARARRARTAAGGRPVVNWNSPEMQRYLNDRHHAGRVSHEAYGTLDDVRGANGDMIDRWTSGYSSDEVPTQIREAAAAFKRGEAVDPADYHRISTDALKRTIETRRERWARAAQAMGLPDIPDFELYRGIRLRLPPSGKMTDNWFVQDVARAWKAEADQVVVRSYESASWTYKPKMGFGSVGDNGVEFRRTFTLEETLFDQIADDADFLGSYYGEHEVISWQSVQNELTTSTRDVRLTVGGTEYTWDKRQQFLSWYEANGGTY